jgi:hypothetical protein
MTPLGASLTYNSRSVIYNCKMFIIQARGPEPKILFLIDQFQSGQKFEKNCPIFGNVAKTVAKLQSSN